MIRLGAVLLLSLAGFIASFRIIRALSKKGTAQELLLYGSWTFGILSVLLSVILLRILLRYDLLNPRTYMPRSETTLFESHFLVADALLVSVLSVTGLVVATIGVRISRLIKNNPCFYISCVGFLCNGVLFVSGLYSFVRLLITFSVDSFLVLL
jgi:phosphatidylglycerophosphate synthase